MCVCVKKNAFVFGCSVQRCVLCRVCVFIECVQKLCV